MASPAILKRSSETVAYYFSEEFVPIHCSDSVEASERNPKRIDKKGSKKLRPKEWL